VLRQGLAYVIHVVFHSTSGNGPTMELLHTDSVLQRPCERSNQQLSTINHSIRCVYLKLVISRNDTGTAVRRL
jgi:hypothetical protein